MIIEGLITSAGTAGSEHPHVAALGPVVNPELTQWTLRPFQSSKIFGLLRANPRCVFHVIDDALPVVQLVLGREADFSFQTTASGAWIIEQACRWYELEIERWDVSGPRSEATARVIQQGELRAFWGWNRARHALLEAAILISRAQLMQPGELQRQLSALRSAIEKTAGPREQLAWSLIEQTHLSGENSSPMTNS